MKERERHQTALFTSERQEIALLLEEDPEDIWISRKGVAQIGSFYQFVIPETVAITILQLAKERDELRAVIARYAEAILTAISHEDGLDGLEGERLLQETEEGRALLAMAAEMPVT